MCGEARSETTGTAHRVPVIIFRVAAALAGLSFVVAVVVDGVGGQGAAAARSESPYRQVAALPSHVVLETFIDSDRRIRIVGDIAGELIHLGQSVIHAWRDDRPVHQHDVRRPDSH
jgi:hypothetical protein